VIQCYYNGVTRLLLGCYKGVTRILDVKIVLRAFLSQPMPIGHAMWRCAGAAILMQYIPCYKMLAWWCSDAAQ
jgi:hypothetical protein